VALTTAPRTAPERPARSGAVRVAFTGSWPSVTAWGAGLILAALGAGGVVGPDAPILTRIVGFALTAVGLAALAWGTAALVRGRILVPRLVVAGAITGMLLGTALLLLSPAHTSVWAVAAATALVLVVAGYAAVALRRPAIGGRAPSVWGLLLAAAVMSVVVTPSLGATQDAILIRGDGTVPAVTHENH
jgi:hypothetical protein